MNSQRATGERAKVFGSMGSSNKMLITGDVDEDELRAAFAEQSVALAEGGADGIVIETMSDLAEAVIALEAARGTGLPVVGCMTFDTGKNKGRTMMGVTPAQAADGLTAAGADVIGANCGAASIWSLPSVLHSSARPTARCGSRRTPACRS